MSTENHRCMGTNCRMPDADNHSPECILETAESQGWSDAPEAVAARQAIAEAEKQEPFGYFRYDIRLDAWVQSRDSNKGAAFYTYPQSKREWVGLTDEEINEVLGSDIQDEPSGLLDFVRALEAKLKEKNT